MKQRNGFVSNSSSSSFVLLLPWEKPTLEQLREYIGPFNGYGFSNISSEDILTFLHKDLQETDSVKLNKNSEVSTVEVINELLDDYVINESDVPFLTELLELAKKYPTAFDNVCRGYTMVEVVEKLSDYKRSIENFKYVAHDSEMYMFKLSYCDEGGGIHCALEHGDHWRVIDQKHPNTVIITNNH